MIKKIIALSLVVISFFSCNDSKKQEMKSEIESLKNQITDLEMQNDILEDSLEINLKNKLHHNNLVGSPLLERPKVNQETVIRVAFYEQWILPPYDVYEITNSDNNKNTRKLLLKQQTGSFFDITIHPKSKQQNEVTLEAIFKINGDSITIPAYMIFDIE